jgi:hypothetical protein
MKFFRLLKPSKSLINMFGVCLIALSGVIANSTSLLLIGEVKPPKCLQDK